uniref:Methyl-CpG-binding domain protein 4 n=1 Tax=Lingulaulax polyedra TaxID=160621 RepID=A0A516AGE4_LINPO|nr:methyl-CpG-binding domain protein 4 [Lingulodinium polyedra]
MEGGEAVEAAEACASQEAAGQPRASRFFGEAGPVAGVAERSWPRPRGGRGSGQPGRRARGRKGAGRRSRAERPAPGARAAMGSPGPASDVAARRAVTSAEAAAATEEADRMVDSTGDALTDCAVGGCTDSDPQSALAAALSGFCAATAHQRGEYRQRTAAAEQLLRACRAAPAPSAVSEAAIRVLLVDVHRMMRSVMCRLSERPDAIERLEICKRLVAIRQCACEHARIVHGLALGRGCKARSGTTHVAVEPAPGCSADSPGSCGSQGAAEPASALQVLPASTELSAASATEPVAQQLAEQVGEQLAEQSAARAAEQPTERSAEPAEQPADQPTRAAQSVCPAAEQPLERLAQVATSERPAGSSARSGKSALWATRLARRSGAVLDLTSQVGDPVVAGGRQDSDDDALIIRVTDDIVGGSATIGGSGIIQGAAGTMERGADCEETDSDVVVGAEGSGASGAAGAAAMNSGLVGDHEAMGIEGGADGGLGRGVDGFRGFIGDAGSGDTSVCALEGDPPSSAVKRRSAAPLDASVSDTDACVGAVANKVARGAEDVAEGSGGGLCPAAGEASSAGRGAGCNGYNAGRVCTPPGKAVAGGAREAAGAAREALSPSPTAYAVPQTPGAAWQQLPEVAASELLCHHSDTCFRPLEGCPWCERRRAERCGAGRQKELAAPRKPRAKRARRSDLSSTMAKRACVEGSEAGAPPVTAHAEVLLEPSALEEAAEPVEVSVARVEAIAALPDGAAALVEAAGHPELAAGVASGARCRLDTEDTLAAALKDFRVAARLKGKYAARLAAAEQVLCACLALPAPSEAGEAAVRELWMELLRTLTNVGTRLLYKRNASERVDLRRQLVALRKRLRAHAREFYQLDLESLVPHPGRLQLPPAGGAGPAASLEDLRKQCNVYWETGSCRHLCEHLCYFREYEPARQLHALRCRARSHPLRPSLQGWTARLALTHESPFWCVVLHDPSGAVRGSAKDAWTALVNDALDAPLPGAASAPPSPLPLSSSQAGASEMQHSFAHPRSPFGLVEEVLTGEPWQLLVACLLLNRTGRIVVDRLLGRFFQRWPSAEALVGADVAELESILAPLGLHRKRSRMLCRFSREYLEAVAELGSPLPLSRLRRLHGVGRYAYDAHELFVRGVLVQPTDIYLGWFVEYHQQTLASRTPCLLEAETAPA